MFITTPCAFLIFQDVEQLYRELKNPIGLFKIPFQAFNHLDYLWAKDAPEMVYDTVMGLMEKY